MAAGHNLHVGCRSGLFARRYDRRMTTGRPVPSGLWLMAASSARWWPERPGPTASTKTDDSVVAILDIHPAATCHVLVIPKRHSLDLWHIEPADAAKVMAASVQVAHIIRRALDPDRINLVHATGRAAWQSVFHFHLHLVPRREGDGMVPPWSLSPPRAEEATLRTVADKRRSAGAVRILELLDRLGLASVPCLMAVGWSAKSRSGPQRGEEAPSKACLDTYQSEFRQRILPKHPAVVLCREAGSAARAGGRRRRRARHGWLLVEWPRRGAPGRRDRLRGCGALVWRFR